MASDQAESRCGVERCGNLDFQFQRRISRAASVCLRFLCPRRRALPARIRDCRSGLHGLRPPREVTLFGTLHAAQFLRDEPAVRGACGGTGRATDGRGRGKSEGLNSPRSSGAGTHSVETVRAVSRVPSGRLPLTNIQGCDQGPVAGSEIFQLHAFTNTCAPRSCWPIRVRQ